MTENTLYISSIIDFNQQLQVVPSVNISDLDLSTLPKSDTYKNVKSLSLIHCCKLSFILRLFKMFPQLETLSITDCSTFDELIIINHQKLKELSITRSPIPSNLIYIKSLQKLSLTGLKVFQLPNISILVGLTTLILKDVSTLQLCPQPLNSMKKLRHVEFSNMSIRSLPFDDKFMNTLDVIKISNCYNLCRV